MSISYTSSITMFFLTSIFYQTSAMGGGHILEQWKQGLSGALLTHYSGSVISNNSSLTVLRFCRNGRYAYQIDAGWSVPGLAGGSSEGVINGVWELEAHGGQMFLNYRSDLGEKGILPIYLQNDGKVNIGGTSFAIQKNAAGC